MVNTNDECDVQIVGVACPHPLPNGSVIRSNDSQDTRHAQGMENPPSALSASDAEDNEPLCKSKAYRSGPALVLSSKWGSAFEAETFLLSTMFD